MVGVTRKYLKRSLRQKLLYSTYAGSVTLLLLPVDFKTGGFFKEFLCMYFIHHCLICRPLYSTVSEEEDAKLTFALQVSRIGWYTVNCTLPGQGDLGFRLGTGKSVTFLYSVEATGGVVYYKHPPEGRSLGFILEVVQDPDELASSNPGAGVVKNLGLSQGDECREAKTFCSFN